MDCFLTLPVQLFTMTGGVSAAASFSAATTSSEALHRDDRNVRGGTLDV